MKNCPYCKTIKDELTKNNIEFEEKINADNRKEWEKITSLTKLPATPTISYKNNYFIPNRDFGNPQGLINLLKNFEESEFSLEKQNNEAIKTLNYQIIMAFNRMDGILKQIETKLNTDEHKSTD